jgi:hypothetical protein
MLVFVPRRPPRAYGELRVFRLEREAMTMAKKKKDKDKKKGKKKK